MSAMLLIALSMAVAKVKGKNKLLDASKSYQVYSYSAIPILNRRDVSNFVHHLKKELNCWDIFLETQAFTFEN